MTHQINVDFFGSFILARISGKPTEALIKDCHDRVLALVAETGCRNAVYEALEMEAPAVDIPWFQRQLDDAPDAIKLRRAVIVPNSKLAYLARLAFGEGDYQVFYNDVVSALKWLIPVPASEPLH